MTGVQVMKEPKRFFGFPNSREKYFKEVHFAEHMDRNHQYMNPH